MENTIKAALLISDNKEMIERRGNSREAKPFCSGRDAVPVPGLSGAAPHRATWAGHGELSLEPETPGLPKCGASTNYPFREAELITLAWAQANIVSRAQASCSAQHSTLCRIDFCIRLIICTMALLELDKHILPDNRQKCHNTMGAENIKILFVE